MPNSRLDRSAPDTRPGQDRRSTLADLTPGTGAQIVAFDAAIPADVANRLRHLGFRPGIQVTKLRTAPWATLRCTACWVTTPACDGTKQP